MVKKATRKPRMPGTGMASKAATAATKRNTKTKSRIDAILGRKKVNKKTASKKKR